MDKKEGGLSDVTMGAFDGAEVCELVGNFLLHQLSMKFNKNDFGLYRDDGLEKQKWTRSTKNKKRNTKIVQRKSFKYNHKMQFKNCRLFRRNFQSIQHNILTILQAE